MEQKPNQPTPPKYTPILTEAIRGALDAKLFHTYARLVALAWRHEFKFTDWLTESELVDAVGLEWSNVKRHLAQLKQAGLITWDNNRKNGRRFSILELRLAKGAKAQYCAPSSSGSSINTLSQVDDLLLEKAQNCALSGPGNEVLDRDAWQALREAGVGEPARTEIANLPTVTAWYIKAHAAGVKRDHGNAGMLIYRTMHDWPAPDWCQECDQIDGHGPDCPTQAEQRRRQAEMDAQEKARQAGRARSVQPESPELAEGVKVWGNALEELKLQLTTATYNTWLQRTAVAGWDGQTLTIAAHNAQAREWIDARLMPMVKRSVVSAVGSAVEVKVIVQQNGS